MITYRWILKGLGKRTIIATPACCMAVCDGPFPYSASNVPFMHCAFETAAITASGIRAGLDMTGVKDVTVVAWAGDGGTFDIGIQALSGSAERNDDILYICYDNEAYMNTGIQRSSATPILAWTTTTPPPYPKETPKKNIGEIMAGHRIPYFATLSLAFPEDFFSKLEKAKKTKGFRMLHIFAPCPTGWRYPENITIKLSRLAVATRIFPIYEIENGIKWILNPMPPKQPVNEYIRLQGRFRHLEDKDIELIQQFVDQEWERLKDHAKS
jgi:pyruvate/2-oxoacid:ferredoxin oxidoreductase beta subunit